MLLVISRCEILDNLCRQINSFFSFAEEEQMILNKYLDNALDRLEKCFQGIDNKYFKLESGEVKFNPFHSVQYMTFLYIMANELYRNGVSSILCDKLYYLNKTMNGLDMFYAIELPEVWSAEHPVGSVLGRAKYGEGFFFYQGCTVGGNRSKDGVLYYPVIGRNVRMYANSSLIGQCNVGDNVILGAGALVKDTDIPSNSIVFGQSPNLIIKENKHI